MTSSNVTSTTDVVLFETLPTHSGHTLAIITLNDPKALNALSVEMCTAMAQQLQHWQQDERVVAILLKGAGDKAFCAGGNIRRLYDSMVAEPNHDKTMPNPDALGFFGQEYALYRQMYFYSKPIILWGNGIVMGGGMGLMAMASHRIVTETTRFAMPEISIGLYPDATGSWFLPRMPAKTGLFMGLTGAQGNASDALWGNIAEYALDSREYANLITQLQAADWSQAIAKIPSTAVIHQADIPHTELPQSPLHTLVSEILAALHHTEHLAASHLLTYLPQIQALMNQGSIIAIDTQLRGEWAQRYRDDSWMQRAISTYQQGCPVSAALTMAAFYRGAKLSLEQVLYMELNISLHCVNNPDFQEGVRALLVDKDKSPRWSRTLANCDIDYINSHFMSCFAEGEHPFADWLSAQSYGAKLAKNQYVTSA